MVKFASLPGELTKPRYSALEHIASDSNVPSHLLSLQQWDASPSWIRRGGSTWGHPTWNHTHCLRSAWHRPEDGPGPHHQKHQHVRYREAQRIEKLIRITLRLIFSVLAGVQDERCCQKDGGEALLWSHHRACRVSSCGVEVKTGSGWRYAGPQLMTIQDKSCLYTGNL